MSPRPTSLDPRVALINLTKVWDAALPTEIHSGFLYWYRLHNALQERVESPLRLFQVAGMMAAMSPNNTYKANINAVDRLLALYHCNGTQAQLEALTVPCYGRDKLKAIAILGAATWEDVDRILRGMKVISFFHNMLYPENTDGRVTIDGHMWNMLTANKVRLNGVRTIRPVDYNAAEAVVGALAHTLRVRPSHLQAVVWLTWKRIHNLAHDPQERLFL